MAIPTARQFMDYLDLTRAPRVNGHSALPLNEVGQQYLTMDVELVESVISAHMAAQHELEAEVVKTAVHKWMAESPQAQRAWASVWGRRTKRQSAIQSQSPAELALRFVHESSLNRTESHYAGFGYDKEKLSDALTRANSEAGKVGRLRSRVSGYLRFNGWDVANGFGGCFYRYFYTEKYRNYCRALDVRVKPAEKLLEAIRVLEDEALWRGIGVEDLDGSPRFLGYRKRVLLSIGSPGREFPIERADGTVRERALAFELWSVCRRKFPRANKAAAVFNFLLMEGVENQPATERAVQRWIKGWVDAGISPWASVDRGHMEKY